MIFRTLGFGLSVGWLVIASAPTFGQQTKTPSKKPRATITATIDAPTPEQARVSDVLEPVEFKPSPIGAYDPEPGSQVVYPQPVPQLPTMVPQPPQLAPPDGMALRVHIVEDADVMSQAVPSPAYYAPRPYTAYPATAVPAGVPYASPPCVYAPPVFPSPAYPGPVTTYGPVCFTQSRLSTKADLLRAALRHLEAAGADDLVKQLRVEIATEEKRELAEELSRKEVELEALKTDVERLREQVNSNEETHAARLMTGVTPSGPVVQVKVQVLDVDLARMKSLGVDLEDLASPKVDRSLAGFLRRKLKRDSAAAQPPVTPCMIDSQANLREVLDKLRAEKAVQVIAEPCLTVESGKPQRFCCGVGAAANAHPDNETCDFCTASGVNLELTSTVLNKNLIRTEIKVRHNETAVVPAHTTGLEGPLPPAIRVTEMDTCFDAAPGQTFFTSTRRQAGPAATDDQPEAQPADGEAVEAAKESKSEVLRLVLVTPCLLYSEGVLPPPAAWAPVPGQAPIAVGIRPQVLLEPFLKDIQADQNFKLGDIEFGGIKPRFLNTYHSRGQNADDFQITTQYFYREK